VRLAPHHDLIRQHDAFRRDKRNVAVLLLEADGKPAGLEQAEYIAGGLVGEPALFRDEIVLGAIAGGDVVLREHRHQARLARDLMNAFGLAFGDKGTERVFRAFYGFGVHGGVPARGAASLPPPAVAIKSRSLRPVENSRSLAQVPAVRATSLSSARVVRA
jgi:hypothetical protein